MEEEALLRIDALIAQVAGELIEETGLHPLVTVVHTDPVASVRDRLKREPGVAALVLGAAPARGRGRWSRISLARKRARSPARS
jgi:hypothetical protein